MVQEADPDNSLVAMPERMIETNGIQLAVYDAGEGPPVVLLHGFPATAVTLGKQFDALVAAGYRVIALDQRGFGKSDFPSGVEAYAMSELTADVAGVIDALALGPVTVIGHDWGGAVAWRLALDHPGKVSRVISLGTLLIPRFDKEPIAARRAMMGDDNYVVAFQHPHLPPNGGAMHCNERRKIVVRAA